VPTTSLPTRFARSIQRWLLVPDREIGWAPDALRQGRRLIREWKPDVVASFSYPFTCHLVGRRLASSFDLPFVTNFSDFWADNRILFDVLPTPLHRALARRLETGVVRAADVNVVITEGLRADFARRHPDVDPSHWAVAYNGFDRADIPRISAVRTQPQNDDRFRLVYTGLAFTDRNSSNDPRPLLRGLARLRQLRPDLVDQLALDLYGTTDAVATAEIEALGLESVVSLHGHVPYQEALAAIAAADVSVVLMTDRGSAPAVLPTKVFDYLGLDRPILAVAYEGEAAHFARLGPRTSVASPDDPDEIARAIESMFEQRHVAVNSTGANLDQYSRKATAAAFDDALRRAMKIHADRRTGNK
jgi:glycosyltransferase involved in cell wall biosynthesis